jgi:hypothetical protein
MAHLLDSPTLDPATASPGLSVVYATEKEGEIGDCMPIQVATAAP